VARRQAEQRLDDIGALDGDVDAGREVFTGLADPSCASCHALRDADAEGGDAPDLDAVGPTEEQVAWSLVSGEVGAHAAQDFDEVLTDQQVADVAAYVAAVADPDVDRFDLGRALDQSPWAGVVLVFTALIAVASIAFAVRIVAEIRQEAHR
jgi:cytochrome c6